MRTSMKRLSRTDKLNWLVFLIPFGAYLALTLLLFHRQSVRYGGDYPSDITPYVEYMQGIYIGYDYPYPIMFALGKLFSLVLAPEMAMAFAVTALNGLTVPFLKYFVDRCVKKEMEWNGRTAILSTLLTFSLLFVSMLFSGFGEAGVGSRYRGVFTPNPWHNATYSAARSFTVVCFFLLDDLLGSYEKGPDWKKYLVFSAFLLLATLTKPSFTFGFVVMAAVILFYRTCRKRFQNFKETMWLACCALPTFAVLLYQFRDVFTGVNSLGEETGIGVGFLTAWSTQEVPVAAAIALGLAFPLTVLACNGKRLKEETGYRLSWQMFLVNLAMLMFLYEKGYRCDHVNFAWGYMNAMFFSFAMSVLLLWKNTRTRRQPVPLLALQWGVYLLHLVCGIVYFYWIMLGYDFL